jgi:hypothetical protein
MVYYNGKDVGCCSLNALFRVWRNNLQSFVLLFVVVVVVVVRCASILRAPQSYKRSMFGKVKRSIVKRGHLELGEKNQRGN